MTWKNKASATFPDHWSTVIEVLKSDDVNEKRLANEYYNQLQKLHKPNSKGDVNIVYYNSINISFEFNS